MTFVLNKYKVHNGKNNNLFYTILNYTRQFYCNKVSTKYFIL